jgi:hypothetical protein
LIAHGDEPPEVMIKTSDKKDVYLFVSNVGSAVSFPTESGFDYAGFTTDEREFGAWSEELFSHYWNESDYKIADPTSLQVVRERISKRDMRERVVLKGSNNPEIDVPAIQNAVDHYKEVILHGKFNLGTSNILLSNSVTIRGEGRENNIPLTILYKRGWSFPFRQFTGIFVVDEDYLDLSIENINFTDFNGSCILARTKKTNRMKILNNRITAQSGHGRGMTLGSFGETFHGFLIQEIGNGGVLVEGNYIDLASWGFQRGSVSRGGLEEDPEYRPDLFNHESYIGFGMAVMDCAGKVAIKNNIVRNANGRGIAVTGHLESADVIVSDNVIESDVYGSYPFSSRESTAGILAQTGIEEDSPNFKLRIENNNIKLNKVNQSGIVALGPSGEGSSKLIGGVIKDNMIYLRNGYEGIHVRKCDDFEVAGNSISGKAYYGIRVSGHRIFGSLDMGSFNNRVKGNNLHSLSIKAPDDYVMNHSDGKMFSPLEPRTACIWLDRFSKNNKITIKENETFIDEGENNQLIISD